jgi:hypothetical protein
MATMLAGVVGEAITPGPTSPSWTDKHTYMTTMTIMRHAPPYMKEIYYKERVWQR